jgi:hypothetical protein
MKKNLCNHMLVHSVSMTLRVVQKLKMLEKKTGKEDRQSGGPRLLLKSLLTLHCRNFMHSTSSLQIPLFLLTQRKKGGGTRRKRINYL